MDLTSSKKILNEEESKKIIIQGQDLKMLYIISNKIYVHNTKFKKKYQYPENFKMSEQIKKGNIVINELLERKR